jgi:hypothetical protein
MIWYKCPNCPSMTTVLAGVPYCYYCNILMIPLDNDDP